MNSIIGKDLMLNGQKLRVLNEHTSSGQYKTTSPELQARLARVNGESLSWSRYEAIYLNGLLIPRSSFNQISENNSNVDLGEIPVLLKVKQAHRRKIIFIIGGVVSSIGKGVIASSLGMLLEARNYKIQLQKFDPYLNVDPGTMSPHQHGEVYVLEDGTEADLDFGHYSRFTNCRFGKEHSVTSGKVYENVLSRERKGDYLGATVQVVPHLIDEIKIRMTLPQAEIIINEIGGCVGDIEAMPYMEAIRQFQQEKDYDVLVLLVSYLVNVKAAGEIKTKPTQHCVAKLKEAGVSPDFLLCRHEGGIAVGPEVFNKLSRFCDVKLANVIPVADCQTIYEVPLKLFDWQLDENILRMLGCERRQSNIKQWVDMVYNIRHVQGYDRLENVTMDGTDKQSSGKLQPLDDIPTVNILMVGKYLENRDSYISVLEALKHAGYYHKYRVNDIVIDAEKTLDQKVDIKQFLDQNKIGGILVPGGYGKRGTEGIIQFIKYARENNVPLFGICLGMQLSVIEYSRHVLGLPDATSEEFDPHNESKNHVIFMMKETQGAMGASQRLGSQEVDLAQGSYISKIYNSNLITERYRHRYVVNPQYFDSLQMNGASLAGRCPISNFPQTLELPTNDFFIAVQYHPEYKSKPLKPQPIFCEFVAKSLQNQEKLYPGSSTGKSQPQYQKQDKAKQNSMQYK